MSDWLYDTGAVLCDPNDNDRWWHVIGRMRDVDTNKRFYRLADATHTEYKERATAEWIEDGFESAGWTTSTKPAAECGYRVNGRLVGPADVERAKGTKCVHDYECPECGADGKAEIDVIQLHSEGRTVYECRVCNAITEDTNVRL